jgi:LPS export ABC transporter permease LptG/LPS export ABC transporter permease LptF
VVLAASHQYMLKLLDRYLIREILLPFSIVLVVLSFLLEIPVILQQGEKLIEKGVEWHIVAHVLLTLLPQALALTIPCAVLVGILVALGRVSADREFVAMQACGISIFRLMRPIALFSAAATAATLYVTIVALPGANQSFREITFNVVASQAETDIKPRVFYTAFPNRVLYVRDQGSAGGWKDVFLADATRADQTTVYFATEGRLLVDRRKRTVQLALTGGTSHTTFSAKPEEYESKAFDSLLLTMDPEAVFPRVALLKGDPEMTIAELKSSAADAERHGGHGYGQHFMIHQKFALAGACAVLGLLGLVLGASNRKDGRLASFAIGFGVIFIYYILLWTSRAGTLSGHLPASAAWIPNILMGAVGVALLVWRARSADQPIRISLPAFWRRPETSAGIAERHAPTAARPRIVVVVRVPHLDLPRPNLLDVYMSQSYLRVFALGFVGLLGIFYISTFMDLADKLFRGTATTGMLLRYFYFMTPQFVYYVIPMAALVATLVTIGLMTKNSELVVMKACGISLYRAAAPLMVFALVASAALFGLQEWVLAYSNVQADRLNRVMRGWPQTAGLLTRQWIIAESGDIYHYDYFDPSQNQFTRLSMYHLDGRAWRLGSLTSARVVELARGPVGDGHSPGIWRAHDGWTRQLSVRRRQNADWTSVKYDPFAERDLALEPPEYFKTEEPEADRMTYLQLRAYIDMLRASGFNAVPYMVQLQRKVAFPLVTIVMTMLAVPFAVTTGRRGAMYGIGIGIVLAIVYWMTMSVFAAVGAGGWISPMLAAWAPNVLFGAAAVYMLLTVRT